MIITNISLLIVSLILSNCQTRSSFLLQNKNLISLRFNLIYIDKKNKIKDFTFKNDEGFTSYKIMVPDISFNSKGSVISLLDNKVLEKLKTRINLILADLKKEQEKASGRKLKLINGKISLLNDKFMKNWFQKNNMLFVVENAFSQILKSTDKIDQIKGLDSNTVIDIYYKEPNSISQKNMFVNKSIINVGVISNNYKNVESFFNTPEIKKLEMEKSRQKVFKSKKIKGTLFSYQKIWKKIFEKEKVQKKRFFTKEKQTYSDNSNTKYVILELENKIVFLHPLSYEDVYFYYYRNIYWSNLYYREKDIFTSLITVYQGSDSYAKSTTMDLLKIFNYSMEHPNFHLYNLSQKNNLDFNNLTKSGNLNSKTKTQDFVDIQESINKILKNDKKAEQKNVLKIWYQKIGGVIFKRKKKSDSYLECMQQCMEPNVEDTSACFSKCNASIGLNPSVPKEKSIEINEEDTASFWIFKIVDSLSGNKEEIISKYDLEAFTTNQNVYFSSDKLKKISKLNDDLPKIENKIKEIISQNTKLSSLNDEKKKEISKLFLAYINLIIKFSNFSLEDDFIFSRNKKKIFQNIFPGGGYNLTSDIETFKLYKPKSENEKINMIFDKISKLEVKSSQFNKNNMFSGNILNVYDNRNYPNILTKDQFLLSCYFDEGILNQEDTFQLTNQNLETQTIKILKVYNIFGDKFKKNKKIESSFKNKKIGLVINKEDLTISPLNLKITQLEKVIKKSNKKYNILSGYLVINEDKNKRFLGFDSADYHTITKKFPSIINYSKLIYDKNGVVEIDKDSYRVGGIYDKKYNIKGYKCEKVKNTFTDRSLCGEKRQKFQICKDLFENNKDKSVNSLQISKKDEEKLNFPSCTEPLNELDLYYNGKYYRVNTIELKEIITYNPYKQEGKINGSQKIYLDNKFVEYKGGTVFKVNIGVFETQMPKFPNLLPHIRLCYTKKKSILNTLGGGRRSTDKIDIATKDNLTKTDYFEQETVGLFKVSEQQFFNENDLEGYPGFSAYTDKENINNKYKKDIIFEDIRKEPKPVDEKLRKFIIKNKFYNPIPPNDFKFSFFNNNHGPVKELLSDLTETFDFGYDFFRAEEFIETKGGKERRKDLTLYRLGSSSGAYGNFFTYRPLVDKDVSRQELWGSRERLKKVTNIAIRDFWIIPEQNRFSDSGLDVQDVLTLSVNKNRCDGKNNKCNQVSKNLMTFFIGTAGDQGGIYSGGDQQLIKLTSNNRNNQQACFYPGKKGEEWDDWSIENMNTNKTCSEIKFEGNIPNILEGDTFESLKKADLSNNGLHFMFNNKDETYNFDYKIYKNDIYIKCFYNYNDGKSSYQGEMKNFLPHGFGEKIYADGSSYKGEWYNGYKYGKGSYIFPRDRWAGAPEYKMTGYWNQVRKMKGDWYFLGEEYYEINNQTNNNSFASIEEEQTIKEGLTIDMTFRQDVVRAVKWQRSQDRYIDWYCDDINSATRNSDGSTTLDLLLCNRKTERCENKKYMISPDGIVSLGMYSTYSENINKKWYKL